MIGIRKSDSMVVVKYLPFLSIVFATICIFTGSVLVILQVSNLTSDFGRFSGIYLVAGVVILALGAFVLAVSPGKTVLLNKKLLVMTVNESTAFSTSVTQYGYDEIAGEFFLDKKYLFRQWFPRYSIGLQTSNAGHLRFTGHSYLDENILFASKSFRVSNLVLPSVIKARNPKTLIPKCGIIPVAVNYLRSGKP